MGCICTAWKNGIAMQRARDINVNAAKQQNADKHMTVANMAAKQTQNLSDTSTL